MTEQTNMPVRNANGTLFYDNTCGFCLRGVNQIQKPLQVIGVQISPFDQGADKVEMVLKWHDGQVLRGADAAIFLARKFPLGYLPATIVGWPPFIYLARAIYRIIAKNRHDICELPFAKPETKPSWLTLVALVLVALVGGAIPHLPGWIWMWLIAFTMWLGFKIMSYRNAGGIAEVNLYFFLWPGMDTEGFAFDNRGITKATPFIEPTIFVICGVVLLTLLPTTTQPIMTGWIGVTAMLCLMHFGTFVWLAAFWNRCGFEAEPIMRKPWLSHGLGDFWGNRWNRAFSDWARDFLFRPLTTRFGIPLGTIGGFLVSGIAHELVISLPARGGYGLPTLYFLIQGFGVLIEKRARLRHRNLARMWLWLIVLSPAPLLFHHPFMEHVFNPMTQLITNLWNH